MAKPVVVKIADAIVAALHAHDYTEAEVRAIPYMVREELDTQKLVVTFGEPTYTEVARRVFSDTFAYRIVLQAAINPSNYAELQANLLVVQSLIRLWQDQLSDLRMADAELVSGPEQDLLYDPVLMHQHQMFVSVFTVTYSIAIC